MRAAEKQRPLPATTTSAWRENCSWDVRPISGGRRWRGRRRLALAIAAAEGVLQLFHRASELRRDDPHLVGIALRDLRKHRQVLVGQELRVGVAAVDRLEHGGDRLGLTLGLE